MRYATIGWMANKNHATIIHSFKNVESMLSIRDPFTINAMNEWETVFNSLFGSGRTRLNGLASALEEIISASGVDDKDVKKLLIERAEAIEVEGL